MGSTLPRLWTPPLRPLTPETTYGYRVIWFAEHVVGLPLDPWEQWAVIHAGEMLEDGRPRFRTVLILVARQNGKTLLCLILSLYWLFVEKQPMVLGTSTNLDYARSSWLEGVQMAQGNEWIFPEIEKVRATNGQECLTTESGALWRVAASNRRGGRSLTVHRLVLDELREHKNWEAWNAATNAMNAVGTAQAVCITNQGDMGAVVLDALRTPALEHIETGAGDPRVGLFEWSADQGADPVDLHQLAKANPNLGRRIDPDNLLGPAMRAKAAGGAELAGFKTEVMCMRVPLVDPGIDPDAWRGGETEYPYDLALYREAVALCMDVSLDNSHASLLAAARIGDEYHVEVVESWDGYGCTKALRAELPDLVRRIRPRVFGYFANGPAAAVAADLRVRKGRTGSVWPPRNVVVQPLDGDVALVCMGLADLVFAGDIVHPVDAMLTGHVEAAQKLKRGEQWVFTRKSTGPIDGAYALAGAVHLARTLPPARPPLRSA